MSWRDPSGRAARRLAATLCDCVGIEPAFCTVDRFRDGGPPGSASAPTGRAP